MLEVTNGWVGNMKGAFRGMRNPMNSWYQTDSIFDILCSASGEIDENVHNFFEAPEFDTVTEENEWYDEKYRNVILDDAEHNSVVAFLGPKDLQLAQKLIHAGSDHSKFMRQILVSCDIDAPLYWWKEMDTYKVGTVANSCSTMHKLASTPITRECFSFDNDLDDLPVDMLDQSGLTEVGIEMDFIAHWHLDFEETVIKPMEDLRCMHMATKDPKYWRALIQMIPSSWNQKRTWSANYAVLRNIYFARRQHKLTEWHTFCDWIESLPYAKQLIII